MHLWEINMLKNHILIVLLLVFLAPNVYSKKFRNSYISFDLPSDWTCSLEGTESVCFNKFNKKAKEAIIILTAKEAGPNDSLNYFYSYLKKTRTLPNRNQAPIMSKVIHVKRRRIVNHEWIDALHMSSEVESYYTRYLATIKEGLAILVTFSAHKRFYTKYSMEFLNAIKSLKVVASKKLLTQARPANNQKPIGPPIGGPPIALDPPEVGTGGGSSGGMFNKIIAALLIIGAVIYYVMMKKKKKKKRKK